VSNESTDEAPEIRKFSTFTGVFVPTLLTILGVIMYVRLGWVVGHAGLAGTFLILTLAIGITICTGLSLASIATNTRIGAGGPYALITRSLGLEVGGSIGIPLYLSRPLGIAMYVFGFREGWLWVFETHDPLLVDLIVFVALFGLAYLSADLAFRVQYLIIAVIVLSIAMILLSKQTISPEGGDINWWGESMDFSDRSSGLSFWVVFAVFFPATTGILAGANMSGDLENPRRAIPVGTLWAIGVSTILYFGLAVWLARAGDSETLQNNTNFLMEESFWGHGVLAGMLGATFSSALAGAVGGPRILMAMGENRILPRSKWLAKTTRSGEPRNSILLTAALTFGCLMFRDLNAIAPLVTMFFLITYLMINVVLLIERSLGLVSFRPTLTIPWIIPLVGAIGCIFAMVIVNPTFALIALGVSVAVYIWIQRRHTDEQPEDVRSSIFIALAEWAAAKVEQLGGSQNVRAWKPNIMLPIQDSKSIDDEFQFLVDVCSPEGSVKVLGIAPEGRNDDIKRPVTELSTRFRDAGVFSRYAVIGSDSFTAGVQDGLEALQGAFFRPNMLFLSLPDDAEWHSRFGKLIVNAQEARVGVLFLGGDPHREDVGHPVVNLYLRPHITGWNVQDAFVHNNLNLTLLMGYRLQQAWGATLNLITVVPTDEETEAAWEFLGEIVDLARIPEPADSHVMVGDFRTCAAEAPRASVNIMGLQLDPDFAFMAEMIETTRSRCLFVADSGRESALA
jgi:amino acid transporter